MERRVYEEGVVVGSIATKTGEEHRRRTAVRRVDWLV